MNEREKQELIDKNENQDLVKTNSNELGYLVDKYTKYQKMPSLEQIEKIGIKGDDPLREFFEKQSGKMNDQEFFQCKQNLFGLFALLDDINLEQETKKSDEWSWKDNE